MLTLFPLKASPIGVSLPELRPELANRQELLLLQLRKLNQMLLLHRAKPFQRPLKHLQTLI